MSRSRTIDWIFLAVQIVFFALGIYFYGLLSTIFWILFLVAIALHRVPALRRKWDRATPLEQ